MNYIEQINVFWKLDAEHSFNGNETRLYFYLLDLSNSLFWKNPLTNADGYTASRVGISVNTLKTVRNRLQQVGLIYFKPGGNGARNKCQYWIVPAAQVLRENLNKVSTVDTLPAETLTPYVIPFLEKTDDINKPKPNQTKKERSPPEKKLVVEEEINGWTTKPSSESLGLDLPEMTVGAIIQQYRITKHKTVTADQIQGLWSVFKIQNFTGEKFYQSPKQVFSHFINWCKTQEIEASVLQKPIEQSGSIARLQMLNSKNGTKEN